jgi:hypothetical protein
MHEYAENAPKLTVIVASLGTSEAIEQNSARSFSRWTVTFCKNGALR